MSIKRYVSLFMFDTIKKNVVFHAVLFILSLVVTSLLMSQVHQVFLVLAIWPFIHLFALYQIVFLLEKKNDKVIGSKYRYKNLQGKEVEFYIKCSESERYKVPKKMYQRIVIGHKVDLVVDPKNRKAVVVLCKEKDKH